MFKTIPISTDPTHPLNADLYLPRSDTPPPLVVAASGGGWRRGKRQDLAQWGAVFAAHGMAFATVDYARALNGPAFPQNVQDVTTSTQMLVRQATDLGIDSGRVGLLGVSAGAHLAALSYLTGGAGLPIISALACIYGPFDLLTHWQEDLAKSPDRTHNLTERMLGCGPFDDPDLYHRASPMRQIRAPKAIPAFLSWGQLDPAIDPAQSAEFAAALQQAGFPVRTRVFPDAGHFWFSDEDVTDSATHAARVAPDLMRFFTRAFNA